METKSKSSKKKLLALLICIVIAFTFMTMNLIQGIQEPVYKNTYERILAEDGFIYGINVPWLDSNYANDIGAGHFPWNQESAFSLDAWERVLTNCKAIGFNAVRIWLFEQGEGIVYDDKGDVIGLQDGFIENLEAILQLSRDLGVNLVITLQPHISYSFYITSVDAYHKFTQMTFIPETRQNYIDKVVTPVCNLFSDYEDIIVALDIYAEPEGDISGPHGNTSQPYGTTWEVMTEHILQVGSKVKEILPDIPITAASGWQNFNSLKRGYYNNLGLDLIGIDIYNDFGDVYYGTNNAKHYESIKDLHLTRPAWVMEFGPITSSNWSDNFQTQSTISFYESAKEAGYKGAFYWMYGHAASGEALTLIGRNNQLRPVAAAIRLFINDIKKERMGIDIEIDKPIFLYGNDALNIQWFGSRSASHYNLERSTDRTNWITIEQNLSPEVVDDGTYICTYQDTSVTPGIKYYYRVTVYGYDGDSLTSDISEGYAMKKITCPPEENHIVNIGFETGALDPYVVYGASPDAGIFGITSSDVNEGQYAMFINGVGGWGIGAYQIVELKPNTEYTFTMFAKASGEGNSAWNILRNWAHIGQSKQFIYDGQWRYYTMDFLTSDDPSSEYRWYFGDGGGTFVFDDMYLFEK